MQERVSQAPVGAPNGAPPEAEEPGDRSAPALPAALVDASVRRALEEDLGAGDLSAVCVPRGARARATLRAKAPGRLAGLPLFARAFELCDPDCRVRLLRADGDAVAPGDEVALVEGDARALLAAERTALNFLQQLSGVATATARLVALAAGAARVLDTRKTAPGLRALQKYAVRCGGGENHRFGLYDEVMVKDNHVELAGRPLEEVGRACREAVGPDVRITVEARDEEEARAAVRGGADVVLLDNMTPASIAALAPRLRALAAELGRAVELEASGGVDEASLAAFARSGVDRISVGALTHSARALDLSLGMEPAP